MALEKEEIDNLKADLKKVYSKAQGQFLYCPAGKNGDPILVLSAKKITMTQVKEVREKAKVKTFVRGRIALEAGQNGKELVFYTKTDPPGKLVKHVKQFFGRSVTKLKNCCCSASVVTAVVVAIVATYLSMLSLLLWTSLQSYCGHCHYHWCYSIANKSTYFQFAGVNQNQRKTTNALEKIINTLFF